jgi:hypothetical protein
VIPDDQQIASFFNWASAITLVGTLLGWLPNILALMGIIWYGMQAYDWIEKRVRKEK